MNQSKTDFGIVNELQLLIFGISASQPISGGATTSPDDAKGQSQPQGPTGPLTTGSGGTTAASPQGGTPPNMQAVPEGSKTGADQNSARYAPSVRRQVRIEKDGRRFRLGGLRRRDYAGVVSTGWFFSGLCHAEQCRPMSFSIGRSLAWPGLPANRTEKPIAARSVFEGAEE